MVMEEAAIPSEERKSVENERRSTLQSGPLKGGVKDDEGALLLAGKGGADGRGR